MADPAAAAHKAAYRDLKASSDVAAYVGARVYDSVPPNAAFPYLQIDVAQVIEDGNTCGDGSEVYVDVHCWSRKPGLGEVLELSGKVRAALDKRLSIEDQFTVAGHFETTRPLRDPDGLTAHAVVTFMYRVVPE